MMKSSYSHYPNAKKSECPVEVKQDGRPVNQQDKHPVKTIMDAIDVSVNEKEEN